MINVNNITFRYGDRVALNGVSFDVSAGEAFALLGPNGSGKTTLFRILSTLLAPQGGHAFIDGLDVFRDRVAVRSRMGVVFQSPSLDIHLTVRENLVHAGHLYGLAGASLSDRVRESLDAVKLTQRANDRVKTLSGGMKRRVELAKCLLHHPRVLILDEPSTGLDPRARDEFWTLLNEARVQRNTTILVTTHLMDEAEDCDRVAIFDRGSLVACDSPTALRHRIGGDCVTVDCADSVALSNEIAKRFADSKCALVNGTVRIESDNAARLASDLLREFGDRVRTLTIGHPTLHDVFIHETGHRFDDDIAEVGK
ncbi:MAG: ABC transporter ATP-binding protein [Phycisphaerales bacterium]|nr:ABC transporter ATP-binding protein [Phycisphaerales bacterium]MCB9854274.1 ABC transporter ATP-binding protein [Phycisphaerales bacterium]